MRHKTTFALSAALAAMAGFATPAAHATEILVTGSGTWGSNVVSTPLSKSGETYSFSFELPSTVVAYPTLVTTATQFVYTLNGVTMTTPAFSGVLFYPSDFGGLFDLDFGNNTPGQISFNFLPPYNQIQTTSGPDLGSDGTLVMGTFVEAAIVDNAQTDGANSFGTAVVTIAPTPTPEPASIALLGAGLMGCGLIRRNARTRLPNNATL